MAREFIWEMASPESQELDGAKLDAPHEELAAQATTGLLVIRHDRIVYEWYAPDFSATRPHYTASLAKALVGGMSLLVALHDGRIGPDDLACRYIPSWRDDPLRSQITIRHLATNSSGIEDAHIPGKGHFELGGWKEAF